VARFEAATRAVGTHERSASEASISGDSTNPDTRSVAVQSSGILSPASASGSGLQWIAVHSSEIFPPLSPLLRARCPHRRMDRIRSFGSTLTVVARDGDDDGTVSRVAALSTFSTDVCGEICPTVPHPLGMVGARLRSFRSATRRSGPGCCVSSCAWEGVCDVGE